MRKALIFSVLIVLGVASFLVLKPRVPVPTPDYAVPLSDALPVSPRTQGAIDAVLATSNHPADAVVALLDGDLLFEYGDTDQIMNGHSTRKSILSLLYGIAVDQGLIDLDTTLAELNIDEATPLTDQEKTATVRDLLMSRSGIYLPAKGEHDAQISQRPKRQSHKPGDYFFHNNFDNNALGTIFMQETGQSIGAFMERHLARPLEMQDFVARNVVMGDPWFMPQKDTLHEMYYMYLSARDFARIGAMVADGGKWRGTQVVPLAWIDQSTAPLSDLSKSAIDYGRYDAAGFNWWLDQDTGTIWSDGYGGHFMLIDPVRKLVLVERNFTGNSLLSTGRWLVSENRGGPGPARLIKIHKLLAADLDQQ